MFATRASCAKIPSSWPHPGAHGIGHADPLQQLADIRLYDRPVDDSRNENGMVTAYVYVDFDTSKVDIGSYVEAAKAAVDARYQASGLCSSVERSV